MEHSRMFDKIKKWFDQGLWNTEMVRNAVVNGLITEDEFLEIVGEN